MKSMDNGIQSLRILVFQEDGIWVGQCVEYDIGAQGRSISEMARRLIAAIEAEEKFSRERHGKAFSGIPAASAHVANLWDNADGNLEGIRKTNGDTNRYKWAIAA